MKRLFITPDDKDHWLRLRSEDVTSTAISALFGLSPYLSKFEYWHNTKNKIITQIEETERMGWGNRLEKVIGEHVITENLWRGESMKDYVRLPDLRVGTSFDFFIETDADGPGILEIKNVDNFIFHKTWTSTKDEVEAPPHIELQVQHQLLVSGRAYAYIAALVGGNNLVLIKRVADPGIQDAIKNEVKLFWESIDNNTPPEPDFEKDAAFLQSLYNHAEPGKVIDAPAAVTVYATRYREVSESIKVLETEKEKWKAMILQEIGDAEKCKGEKFSISAGITGECQMNFIRKSFRNFRITWRKEDA